MPGSFFPKRTVHLDFHTGPDIPDVGSAFDPEAFAQTFVDAHVDSVTLFAKCHHGLLYFDTERPERHPGLPRDRHLLEDQVQALHAVGIRTPIYLSVQCDEYAANAHPEWVALDEDLRQVKWGGSAYRAGWQILDMSSPYQDYLADQIQEVVERFAPLDGVFLDMCWDQPSSSVWARRAMQERGVDPADPLERDRYAREVAHAYMGRYRDLIEPHLAADVASGVWFNSRPKTALAEESQFSRHVEIESLPSGGWGYANFPYVSRFARTVGRSTLSHTGRFYKGWGDNGGLKPHAALTYECTRILAQGMTAGVGDLLAPSGALDPSTYELIGSVYGRIERCEPLVEDAHVVSEIAVLVDADLGDNPGAAGIGAVRALQQLRQQFDILAYPADFAEYGLVILLETTPIDSELARRLAEYVDTGGRVLVVRGASQGSNGAELLPFLGVEWTGDSPYPEVFLRRPEVGGVNGFDHVMYERSLRIRADDGTVVLTGVVEPYFARSWDRFSGHEYTPNSGRLSPWAAMTRRGPAVLAAVPLFEAFGEHGAPAYRDLIATAIGELLPRPAVRVDGPTPVEATLMRSPHSTIVHLLSFLPTRVGEQLDLVEDPFPVVDLPVAVRSDSVPSRVTLEPAGEELPFTVEDGYVQVRCTILDGHALLVLHDPETDESEDR
ncbi:alpha-L-fucosidase [Homoserinibacter sp. GY 40078]|uniref:alpha-L-fucosidase n=1 Tax=Homoserinibacter sp. GY 40078 TaxID=2603275 RepID=UPI0011CC989C|nr:alpha-L-fucosidase [Homoserinibacter sp. GY 40078]TXK19385.1 hypothetical protein FVQ89_05635 [Homoserinibacter sp. GY 40078]